MADPFLNEEDLTPEMIQDLYADYMARGGILDINTWLSQNMPEPNAPTPTNRPFVDSWMPTLYKEYVAKGGMLDIQSWTAAGMPEPGTQPEADGGTKPSGGTSPTVSEWTTMPDQTTVAAWRQKGYNIVPRYGQGGSIMGYSVEPMSASELAYWLPKDNGGTSNTPTQYPLPAGYPQTYTDANGNVMSWNPYQGTYDKSGYNQTTGQTQPVSPTDQARLTEDQRQFNERLAWEREQAARSEAAAKQQRLATLASQGPASWLQYALEAGTTPVVQDWMTGKSAIGGQAQALNPNVTQGQAIPGWQPLPQTGTGSGAPTAGASGSSGTLLPGVNAQAPGRSIEETNRMAQLNRIIQAGGTLNPADQAWMQSVGMTGSVDSTLASQIDARGLWGSLPALPGESTTDYYKRLLAQPTAPTGGGGGGGVPPPPMPPVQPPTGEIGVPVEPVAPPPSKDDGSNQPWLPPGYEGYVGMATGGDYYVDQPTPFLAGEAGPELVSARPLGQTPYDPPIYVSRPGGQGGEVIPKTSLIPPATGSPIPPNTLPNMLAPSRQYQARLSPDQLAQYYAFEQMRTGVTPEAQQWMLWSMAPPSGANAGPRWSR